MRRLWRENSLSIVFGLLFLGALVGQAIAGHSNYNNEHVAQGGDPVSLGRYVLSSAFGVAVMENWQSEYLQFTLYILLTIWLVQKGSPESKEPGNEGHESDARQKVGRHAGASSPAWAALGGLRTWAYSYSLVLVMGAIWLWCWLAQSVTGLVEYNAQRSSDHEAAIGWLSYIGTASFWERTLQNWQSEFLAVGSMSILAVYLRARGSPESKAVGAPHEATGQGS
jgi:hypothetical protein